MNILILKNQNLDKFKEDKEKKIAQEFDYWSDHRLKWCN